MSEPERDRYGRRALDRCLAPWTAEVLTETLRMAATEINRLDTALYNANTALGFLIASHDQRTTNALDLAMRYGGIDGDHHTAWLIDQIVRELTGEDYNAFIVDFNDGEHGPDTYEWDEGIAP